MSTPYHIPSRMPAAPHPTLLSTPSLGVSNQKVHRAPIQNPYDKFTQPEFDAWIGGITGALRKALGQDVGEEIEKEAKNTDAFDKRPIYRKLSAELDEEEDYVEDSFAEIKVRRALGKGKARDPREGPGLGPGSGNRDQPIEIGSDSDSEEEEGEDEDEELDVWQDEEGDERDDDEEADIFRKYDEDIRSSPQGILDIGRASPSEQLEASIDDYEALYGAEDGYVQEEDADQAEEDEGGFHVEGDVEEGHEVHQRSVEIIELGSDDDQDDDQADHDAEYSDEGQEGLLEPRSSPPPEDVGVFVTPYVHRGVKEREMAEDHNSDEEDQIQDLGDDTSFPPQPYSATRDERPLEIPDPWAGPQTYAEDYYSGGDASLVNRRNLHADYLEVDSPIVIDGDEIQPAEDDTAFPETTSQPLSAAEASVDIPDVWTGPETYAKDYYAGGDLQLVAGQTLDPSHLGPYDDDFGDFLTPDMGTPHVESSYGLSEERSNLYGDLEEKMDAEETTVPPSPITIDMEGDVPGIQTSSQETMNMDADISQEPAAIPDDTIPAAANSAISPIDGKTSATHDPQPEVGGNVNSANVAEHVDARRTSPYPHEGGHWGFTEEIDQIDIQAAQREEPLQQGNEDSPVIEAKWMSEPVNQPTNEALPTVNENDEPLTEELQLTTMAPSPTTPQEHAADPDTSDTDVERCRDETGDTAVVADSSFRPSSPHILHRQREEVEDLFVYPSPTVEPIGLRESTPSELVEEQKPVRHEVEIKEVLDEPIRLRESTPSELVEEQKPVRHEVEIEMPDEDADEPARSSNALGSTDIDIEEPYTVTEVKSDVDEHESVTDEDADGELDLDVEILSVSSGADILERPGRSTVEVEEPLTETEGRMSEDPSFFEEIEEFSPSEPTRETEARADASLDQFMPDPEVARSTQNEPSATLPSSMQSIEDSQSPLSLRSGAVVEMEDLDPVLKEPLQSALTEVVNDVASQSTAPDIPQDSTSEIGRDTTGTVSTEELESQTSKPTAHLIAEDSVEHIVAVKEYNFNDADSIASTPPSSPMTSQAISSAVESQEIPDLSIAAPPAQSEPDAQGVTEGAEYQTESSHPVIIDTPFNPPGFLEQPTAQESPDHPDGALPCGIVLLSRKSTDPVLLSDPYPYSLSTPGTSFIDSNNMDISEDDTENDISMSSSSTNEKVLEDKDVGSLLDDREDLDLELQYPATPDNLPAPSQSALIDEIAIPQANIPTQTIVEEDKDADGEVDPEFSAKNGLKAVVTPLAPTLSKKEEDPFELMGTGTANGAAPGEVKNDDDSGSPDIPSPLVPSPESSTLGAVLETRKSSDQANEHSMTKQTVPEVPNDSPAASPTAPAVSSSKTSPPGKRKRATSSPKKTSRPSGSSTGKLTARKKSKGQDKPQVSFSKTDTDVPLDGGDTIHVRPRNKGKEKEVSAHAPESKRSIGSRSNSSASSAARLLRLGSRASSRSSSIVSSVPSDRSSHLDQPSPTVNRPNIAISNPVVPPPSLFHAHGQKRNQIPKHLPLTISAQQQLRHTRAPSFTRLIERQPTLPTSPSAVTTIPVVGPAPAPPKKPTPVPSSPVTRSHCRFHKISIPKEEDGPRIYFIVPGCSLTKEEVIEEEEIEDHGDATFEDSRRMVDDIESLGFHDYLIGVLRLLVGSDIIREREIFYLPAPGEEIIRKNSILPLQSPMSSRAPVSAAGSTSTSLSAILHKNNDSDKDSLSSITDTESDNDSDYEEDQRRPKRQRSLRDKKEHENGTLKPAEAQATTPTKTLPPPRLVEQVKPNPDTANLPGTSQKRSRSEVSFDPSELDETRQAKRPKS